MIKKSCEFEGKLFSIYIPNFSHCFVHLQILNCGGGDRWWGICISWFNRSL